MNRKKKLAINHFIAMTLSIGVVMGAHYVYDVCPNLFTSLFFPVNESIWEHNKLFVLPVMLVYLIVYLLIGNKFKNYLPSAFLSLIMLPISSSVIFQIYLMIASSHHPASGIIVSVVILAAAFVYTFLKSIGKSEFSKTARVIIYVSVIVFVIIMAIFTYYPPKAHWLEWLFMDHENMCYGIIQN